MYIIDNEITVTWVLAPTATPLLETDFDISFSLSSLDGTYTDAAIINFVAATAITAGSIQYKFIPRNIGRYRLHLTCGVAAAYEILDDKDFWVFESAPISSASLKILSAGSIAGVIPLNLESASFSNQWAIMQSMTIDPSNPDVIWYAGVKDGTDVKAGIGNVNIKTGVITDFPDVITFPTLKNVGAIAVSSTGRVVVMNVTAESSSYWVYYSDAPYTTWTRSTKTFSTEFAGNVDLIWDKFLGVYWWITGINMSVSYDAVNFVEQKYDALGDNVFEESWQSSISILRHQDVGANVLYGFSNILGGGDGERIWTNLSTSFPSLPTNWQNINARIDVFGDPPTAGQVTVSIVPDLDKGSAWMIGGPIGFVIEAPGGVTFTRDSAVDISSQISNRTPTRFFTIHDFGKAFLGCYDAGMGGWAWFESTNMVTWTVSTDTRIVSNLWTAQSPTSWWQFESYDNNSGIAWIELVDTKHDIKAIR